MQFLLMHQYHHALLFHVHSENSSINVALCILCETKTTIETHVHFLIDLQSHMTKSNVEKMVTHADQPIIKQLKVVLYITKIVGSVITYVEVNFLQYHPLFFNAIWPMLVSNMDHYAHLI